jgi:hypothetical protein
VNDPKSRFYVAPHDFEPLRWWDRFTIFGTGRCKRCMASASLHWDIVQLDRWAEVRPSGDFGPTKRGALRRRRDVPEIQSTETPTEGKE